MKFNEKFIEALRYVVAHPENEEYKQQMESYITSKGNALEEALLNSEDYADLYTNYLSAVGRLTADGKEYNSAEENEIDDDKTLSAASVNAPKTIPVKKTVTIVAGVAVALTLAGVLKLRGCALQKTNEQTQIVTSDGNNLDVATVKAENTDVKEGYAFNANDREQIVKHVSDFMSSAKELGYEMPVENGMEIYAIANIDSIDLESFNAFDFRKKNPEIMMEHWRDMGTMVRDITAVSSSKYHFDASVLFSNEKDIEAIKKIDELCYKYNEAKGKEKVALARQIEEFAHETILQEKSNGLSSSAKMVFIEYLTGIRRVSVYAGRMNKEEVDAKIFADDTEYDVYTMLVKVDKTAGIVNSNEVSKKDNASTTACDAVGCAHSLTDPTKYSEENASVLAAIKYAIQNSHNFTITVDTTIAKDIKANVDKVKLGTRISFDQKQKELDPIYNDNHFEMPTPKGQSPIMTPQEQASVVQDENGNLVLPQGETGPSQEEQTKQKQEENLDALRTEASSAAAQKAWNDAMAGVYDSSVPAQYARVADTYINDYNDAYNRAKAQLQPVPTPGQEETHFEPLPEPEVVEEKVTVTETTPEPVQQTAPAAPEAANYTVEEVSTPAPTLDPNLETIYAIDPNDPKWDQSVTTFEELPAEEQVVVQDNSTSSVNWNMMQQLRAAKGNLEANKEASDGLDISFGSHTM